jgi:two-component system response regulator NreC
VRPLRVLLADDHTLMRDGLRALIETQSDMMVVGEAADVPQIVPMVLETSADVLLLDVSLPSGEGLDAVEEVRAKSPGTRVIVLTMHGKDAYLERAAATQLIETIRVVSGWSALLSPAAGEAAGVAKLSPREEEVLRLLAHGHTNQDVADRLELSVKTVESYRARLKIKLCARDRTDLVRAALQRGLLQEIGA